MSTSPELLRGGDAQPARARRGPRSAVMSEPAEATATLVVIAKRPVPGRVKTRLQVTFTPEEAAALAAASLADTLAALAAAPALRRVVALDDGGAAEDGAGAGPSRASFLDDDWVPAGFDVVDQGDGGLDQRLATSLGAVLDPSAPGHVPGPALLVGMDTPQLTPELLDVDWTGLDAVIGMATDGGFWAIGLREPRPDALLGVPMSTTHTGADQLERLRALGLRVGMLPWLRDVDEPADATAAAAMAPGSRFAALHAELAAEHAGDVEPAAMFAAALAGEVVHSLDGTHRRRLPAAAWVGDPDPVDEAMLERCRGPVLDVGCGPGRMVAALTQRGHDALGIDIDRSAVASTAARGGTVLRRSVHHRLPGEGRWGTVLLADGNIGIGGDPRALLLRCAALLEPGGRVVVEAEAAHDGVPADEELDVRDAVVLEHADGRRSRPLPWARLGGGALVRLGARCGLDLAERCESSGRVVLVLVKPSEG